MSHHSRTSLSCILLGDELGQMKLIQLDPFHVNNSEALSYFKRDQDDETSRMDEDQQCQQTEDSECSNNWKRRQLQTVHDDTTTSYKSKTVDRIEHPKSHKHRIVKFYSHCLQREPAASRAITNIRPIQNFNESNLDTTDKSNNLFLIANKVGQLFVCDTDAIKKRLEACKKLENRYATNDYCHEINNDEDDGDDDDDYHNQRSSILSPIYYNMNSKVPVCGGQPINQTNILVVYQNGDIQHVNIGQDILQSTLKIKRKAVKLLGLCYNSDAKAVHWRIDGSTGICYFDSDASSAHMNENDPLTEIALSSPTHKMSKRQMNKSQHNLYNKSPCIQSRKYNEQDRLVPTQVINMITSRTDQYMPIHRLCKWSSITSLNLIYRKLALYDLVGSDNLERPRAKEQFKINNYKLNDDRLAVGGSKYALRVYDVQTQQAIYNCKTGSSHNPLVCPAKGEPIMIGDLEWLGGNKTTKKPPNMLAICSGVGSIVNVYDLRSPKPVFYIDLTQQTENKWQPYKNHPRGCMFTSICASGAPYSTAVPSQQLALGSTNGQLHIIDLRFVAKSHRALGKLSGFCGGSVREIRFVSESFETSKMISCASDRFVRVHRIQTSFTSVVSQKLATKVFLGTKPTCIQPVCDEISQGYLSSLVPQYCSESHISTIGSGSWSLM